MHVCALAPFQKTWLLYRVFFQCQNCIVLHLLSLQFKGEAYYIKTAVKRYLNSFKIKAQDFCCLINSRLRNTCLILCVCWLADLFQGKPDRLMCLNSGKDVIPYAFNKE